ncbi:hypothetical protein A1O7_00269 [Cladophialophora yegresii CBS 114405]|uniref:Mid2 domain-containing protein n=1 Tax=Cladophialophora yegresii CBS 114405 TaxID=1182544 RepID=W9X0C0_9EURO|nr:uncharacterized protein A1O7_00269 [Cladophialophora yegresii CBS 114405]EXJ63934.1 hypothetical protein A1O7_00269 [Cladophialophora yegresii CBS 114405]
MLVLFVACALLFSTYACADGTLIPITFYTNFGFSGGCTTPSTLATNVSLEIGVCVVTPGLGSFHLGLFPCASGSVQQYVFTDTACGQLSSDYYSGVDDCYVAYYGAMAAIMLSCNQESPEPPSATTTIPVAAIATGASSSSTSSTTSASSNGGGDNSSPSGTSSSPSPSSSSSASGWSSLDLGTRIGIIVSLAVGIPPIILGIYTILQRRKRKADDQLAQAQGTPMQPYPPYAHGHGGGGLRGYFPLDHAGREPRPPGPTPQMSRAYYNIDLGTRGA